MLHATQHCGLISLARTVQPLMRRFWVWHAALPAAVFCLLFVTIEVAGLDIRLADALFYDGAAHRWIGADTGWAVDFIHARGRDVVRVVALGSLLTVIASFVTPRAISWRRDAAYVLLSIVLSTSIVGMLKHITNVDCPWDLAHYGGVRPYVALFADRPAALPRAACFPGAHSSSGFALMCFYFVLRARGQPAARWGLIGGAFTGALFSLGQQARGAHFLSHDLTSAAIVWCVLLLSDRWRAHHFRSSGTTKSL
jgi:membrane-associated PAP2 superfamily phosphatase